MDQVSSASFSFHKKITSVEDSVGCTAFVECLDISCVHSAFWCSFFSHKSRVCSFALKHVLQQT